MLFSSEDRAVLAYRPFQGDETDVTPVRAWFLKSRQSHRCVICREKIPPSTRVRAITEVNNEDHKVMTFYCCTLCCKAMAQSWSDDGRAIEDRTSIGMRHSRRRKAA